LKFALSIPFIWPLAYSMDLFFHRFALLCCFNVCVVWDQTKVSRFSWICYDVSTYEYYTDETTYENSLICQGSTLQLSSLTHVMHSLTHNAREIFLLLVNHQLASHDNSTYIGMCYYQNQFLLYVNCLPILP